MLLLTGPPAAGKTSYCLAALRDCLRAKNFDCALLVPTSTMAEHLRNELAREGFVFSPRLITTFGRFIDGLAPGLKPVGDGTLQVIVERVLASMPPGRYSGVRDYRGFRSALAGAIREYAGAGGDASHLHLTDPEFAVAHERVVAELKRQRLHLRSQRLAHAASAVAEAALPARLWITGFTAFTPPEAALLAALARRSDVTVTLPSGTLPGVTDTRVLPPATTAASRTLVVANTPDGEATEIARRMLAEAREGRLWREMGVVVRGSAITPALRTAFERFGIPARFYFAPPLATDATVRYLLAIVDAALSGWEHKQTLEALRMHGSPLEHFGDWWEYSVCESLPGRGLDELVNPAPESCRPFFAELAQLTTWREQRHTPAGWAQRFTALSALFRTSAIDDGIRPDLWREQSAALDAFAIAAEEAASALDAESIDCSRFLETLRIVLRSATLRVPDRRRDVVHVLDAFEARQWRLPVIFVAGLLEGEFPKHHTENAVLSDDVRHRLRAAGVPVHTSADRQAQEQELFEHLLTRATSHIVLSYPRLNAKGEANLRSFLLERARPFAEEAALAVRPKPVRPRAPEPFAIIASDDSLAAFAARHSHLTPTGIETYANCAYSFFGMRTLRLRTAPEEPFDRFNMLVQGTLAHLVFEMHFRDGVPVREAFDAAFARVAAEKNIPPGYRTEAVRLELLHGVEELAADPRARIQGVRSLFEQSFEIDLGDGVAVKGTIDRIEIDGADNGLIVDYKYRSPARLRSTVTENQRGERVQTGMYLLGARALKLNPVGMAYCGFKKEVSVGGWVVQPHYPALACACSEEHLTEVIAAARETAVRVASEIRGGRIEARPADPEDCQWCDLVAICRYESREAPRVAEVSGHAG